MSQNHILSNMRCPAVPLFGNARRPQRGRLAPPRSFATRTPCPLIVRGFLTGEPQGRANHHRIRQTARLYCLVLVLLGGMWIGLCAGTGSPAAEPNIVMTADRFEVSGEQNIAKAMGGVQLTRGPLIITAAEAHYLEKAGRIDLFSKPGTPISFQYKAIHGRAGRAAYNLKEKKILLQDHPVVDRKQDHLEGKTITFFLEGERLVITGSSKVNISEALLKQEQD